MKTTSKLILRLNATDKQLIEHLIAWIEESEKANETYGANSYPMNLEVAKTLINLYWAGGCAKNALKKIHEKM